MAPVLIALTILRGTKKVQRYLPHPAEPATASTETALGDWYANRIVVDRKPLLLLVSARSLLAVLVPARDLKNLPAHLPELVGSRLRRLGIPRDSVEAEVRAMDPVSVAPTIDRTVLGYVVQFGREIPYHLEIGGWDETTLPFVEGRLAVNPSHLQQKLILPGREATDLLNRRWAAT